MGKYNLQNWPTGPSHIQMLMGEKDLWHDTCHCLCSPNGCTPISIVVSQTWHYTRFQRSINGQPKAIIEEIPPCIEAWRDNLIYQPDTYSSHTSQLLQALLFEIMGLEHTCTRIDESGKRYDLSKRPYYGHGNDWRHLKEEFQLRLEKGLTKMDHCHCDILYRPVCGLSSEKCPRQVRRPLEARFSYLTGC